MTLLEAFQALGRPCTSAAGDAAVQNQAAHLLLVELRRLAGRSAIPRDIAEDAIGIALARMAGGVHLHAAKPPASDDEVRAYLYRAVRNNALSLLRAQQRLVSLEPEDLETLTTPGPAIHPEEELDRARERRARDAARRELRMTVVPRVASTLNGSARGTFLESFADLEAVASGATTLAECLERRKSEIGRECDDARARNWFDQRCSRARKVILRYIDGPKTPASDRPRLKRALDELRLRP
jgi:DNA-directed RNA polymerase specialized sigma24 family protein